MFAGILGWESEVRTTGISVDRDQKQLNGCELSVAQPADVSSLRPDVTTGVMAQAVAPNATGISQGVVNWQLTATLLTTRTRSVAFNRPRAPQAIRGNDPSPSRYRVLARTSHPPGSTEREDRGAPRPAGRTRAPSRAASSHRSPARHRPTPGFRHR